MSEPKSGTDFIRALLGAWDCCGTCAGGVLARHDAAVAKAAVDAYHAELGKLVAPTTARTCVQHGDQIVYEPGGVDMPTIRGRWYCPTCQTAAMALIDADGADER